MVVLLKASKEQDDFHAEVTYWHTKWKEYKDSLGNEKQGNDSNKARKKSSTDSGTSSSAAVTTIAEVPHKNIFLFRVWLELLSKLSTSIVSARLKTSLAADPCEALTAVADACAHLTTYSTADLELFIGKFEAK